MKVTFLLFIFYFSLRVLSPSSSETEQEYVHKDKKKSIVYTDWYRLGSEGEKARHLLNTNEASRLMCWCLGSEAACHLLLEAEISLPPPLPQDKGMKSLVASER